MAAGAAFDIPFRKFAMLDFALGVLIFVGRAINFVLDIMLTVTRLQRWL
jgi:hypothetical protein